MKKVIAKLDRVGRFVENAALVGLLCGMMLLAVGQIIAREVFSTGFVYTDELIKLMLLWLAMVGSVAASRDDRHIRIDALSHLLPPMAVKISRLVVDVFAAIVCGVIAWHAYRYLLLEIEFEDTVLNDVPMWIAHSIVPVAFLLLTYRFAVLILWQLYAMFGKDLDDDGVAG
ncbi:MAG: TRAP transporter small permease [Woeseiaceae bacterium]|nr:TRAP transporter small permease [Woeseiaceae bacterium]